MGHLQQGRRTLLERLALEFGNPELSHQIVNKGPLRRHHAARLQHGHDARDPATVDDGARRRDNHRPARVTVGRSDRKNGLAARSGVHERTERLGAGLPAQVHGQGIIHGNIVLLIDQQA